MAYSGIIKDANGDDFYPLTHADSVILQDNTTVQTAISDLRLVASTPVVERIENNSIPSQKINYSEIGQRGDWVLLDTAYLTANTTSTRPLIVNIPTDFQGAYCEYKLSVGFECITAGVYPRLQVGTAGGWQANNISFSYIKDENNATARYAANGVTAFGFEWHVVSANDSCCAEILVSRAGIGNFWNACSKAGGLSAGYASVFAGAARTSFATPLKQFCISSSSITLLAGSHLTLYGRKYNNSGGLI